MANIQAFFHMGGYALYVWPSFLLCLVVLLANVWISKKQLSRALQDATKKVRSRSKPQT